MEKPTTQKITARYVFTQDERNDLADQLTAAMLNEEQIESELSSVKADFKGRIERASSERTTLAQKLRDKFEMRDTLAVVIFDAPVPGRKSFYVALSGSGFITRGAFIRDEPMTYDDKQRVLPLEESTPAPAETQAEETEDKRTAAPPATSEPGQTSLADAFDAAASGAYVAHVMIDLSADWDSQRLLRAFKKAAKKAQWNAACISLISDRLKECETVSAMIDTLRPHVIGAEPTGDEAAQEYSE